MLFTSCCDPWKLVQGTPNLGLMPAFSLLGLVNSSPFPLSANIACIAVFAATVAIWAMVYLYMLDGLLFLDSLVLLFAFLLYIIASESAFYEIALY